MSDETVTVQQYVTLTLGQDMFAVEVARAL